MKIYWKLFIAFWLVTFLMSSSALFVGRIVGGMEHRPDVPPRMLLRELGAILRRSDIDAVAAWVQSRRVLEQGDLYIWQEAGLAYPAQASQQAKAMLAEMRRDARQVVTRRKFDGMYYYVSMRGGSGARYEILMRLPPPWQHRLREFFGLRFLLALLLSGGICYWLARRFTGPISELGSTVRRFANGDLSARVKVKEAVRGDEITALGRDFNHMAGRIGGLVEAERRLLADVSHELRSPLARLAIAVGLARREEGDREAWLARMEIDLARLDEIIGNLLLLPRLEADGRKLADVADLGSLLQVIVSDLAIEARASGKNIHLQILAEQCLVQSDNNLLRSALENIIRNAVIHTPQGADVDVSLRLESGQLQLKVRDYGPGVPASELDKIFLPFYRVDQQRSRDSGGVGLGLAIALRAITLHGGTVGAENAAPGLCVRVSLPVAKMHNGDKW